MASLNLSGKKTACLAESNLNPVFMFSPGRRRNFVVEQMKSDLHREDLQSPLRILVIGEGRRAISELINDIDDLDKIEFVTVADLDGARQPDLAGQFDVIVWSALRLSDQMVEKMGDVGASIGIPRIGLCNGSAATMVSMLNSGIDDVDRAPISRSVLVARLERIRRNRSAAAPAPADSKQSIQFGPIRLDRVGRECFVDRSPIHLTPTEYKLLEFLMLRPGECVSRDSILDAVWGIDFDTGTNLVDMYIYFVRKRLKGYGITGVVRTVRGAGYRFVPPDL